MVEHVFNTHSFLYTLSSQHPLDNYSLTYMNSVGNEEEISLKQVIITSSHITCRIITNKDEKKTLNIFRIRKIFNGSEIIWDNSEQDLSTTKAIKRY